jgi:hypothetical protein
MTTREEHIKAIEEAGGKWLSSNCYSAELMNKYEIIDMVFRDDKIEDAGTVRNRFAKMLRKDGFTVKSTKSTCMGVGFYEIYALKEKAI